MCGLVGVAGLLGLEDRKMFKNLLYMDALRGHHSTGVVNVSHQGDVSVHKKAMTALDYLDSKAGTSLIDKGGVALLGHNRYATMGKITSENAHPFTHGSITGMHNGTLTRQSLLPEYMDFDVDSENVMYSLNKIGVEETIKLVDGAAAFVWWNTTTGSLNIWRNNKRPLYWCLSEDGRTLYWASEKGMLYTVLSGDRRKDNKRFQSILAVPLETHVEIFYSGKGGISWETTPMKGAEPLPVKTYSNGYSGSDYWYGNQGNKSTTHNKKAATAVVTVTQNKPVNDHYKMNATILLEKVKFATINGKVSDKFWEASIVGEKDKTVSVRFGESGHNLNRAELRSDGQYLATISSVHSTTSGTLIYIVHNSLKKRVTTH